MKMELPKEVSFKFLSRICRPFLTRPSCSQDSRCLFIQLYLERERENSHRGALSSSLPSLSPPPAGAINHDELDDRPRKRAFLKARKKSVWAPDPKRAKQKERFLNAATRILCCTVEFALEKKLRIRNELYSRQK